MSSSKRLTIIDRLRGRRASATTSSGSDNLHPQTPALVVAFVNSLNAGRLSNLLTWYAFYDTVKLPESPSRWYKSIYSMDMQGWISLGSFLAQGTHYGTDLVVLDSLCDRLRLDRQVVHDCLTRIADPDKMTWTELATTFRIAKQQNMPEIHTLELVEGKLQALRALATRLKPIEGSEFEVWVPKIVERLNDFLTSIVRPRILALRDGTGVPFGVWEEKTRDLIFFFEAMQQARQVPLTRYGIYPDSLLHTRIPSSSPRDSENLSFVDDQAQVDQECELERSFSTSSLQSKIGLLRSRLMQAEAEKQKLQVHNRNLTSTNNALIKKLDRALTKKLDKTDN